MTAIPGHIHISEREPDGTWEDCTFDSGLEFYRDAFDSTRPATHAEAEAIRKVSGRAMTGGTNLGDFRKGVKARYGVTLPGLISNRTILTVLKPGYCAVVQGSMSAFGPTHRLSKWDPKFDDSHAVYLANVGGTLLWCDPEAPTSADVPVSVTSAEVTKFVNAFSGAALVAPIKALQKKDTMYPITQALLGASFTIKADSNIRVEPHIAATKVRTSKGEVVANGVGTVTGDKDPANGSTVWYGWLEGGQWRFTAKDNVTKVTPLVTTVSTGITQADLDAAIAKANAADAARVAAEAKAATATADAMAEAQRKVLAALGLGG